MQNLVTNIYVLLMPSLKVSHMQVLQNFIHCSAQKRNLMKTIKGKKVVRILFRQHEIFKCSTGLQKACWSSYVCMNVNRAAKKYVCMYVYIHIYIHT